MTDEPDLSMLRPTTVAYLRERAELFALARLHPHPAHARMKVFDVLRPFIDEARAAGNGARNELYVAQALMWQLTVYAATLTGQRRRSPPC